MEVGMAEEIRILLLNYEFPPLGGGAGHASLALARALAADGHGVDIVTAGLPEQPAHEILDGVRVHRVATLRRGLQDGGLRAAASYLRAARPVCRLLLRSEPFDVVHYFFGLPTGALSLLLPELRALPSVISLRGSDVPGYDESDQVLRLFHAALAPVTRRIWRGAGALVANSEALRGLAERFDPGRTVVVVPNAVEGEFRPGSASEHARERVRVLAVSRLIRRKGLDHLLRAVALLGAASLELRIQGSGRDEAWLRQLARDLGIADRVDFAGPLERSQLPQVYREADVFVLPSLSESCSMALLEAMASGLPVVATADSGSREHVEHGAGGFLVPAGEAGPLAEALGRLVAHPELRRAMGAHNADCIRKQGSWEKVAERYLGLYTKVIAERHRDLAREGS
jgi:glycosyltransferase involved in cell wall biosynthesis